MELWQMMITSLAVPLIMIVFGLFARIGLPKKVNWWVGYRTPMACKNQDTWSFAHRHAGKLWVILGLILLASSITALALIDNEASPAWLAGIAIAQLVVLLLALIPTEIALRKEFDKNGKRRR